MILSFSVLWAFFFFMSAKCELTLKLNLRDVKENNQSTQIPSLLRKIRRILAICYLFSLYILQFKRKGFATAHTT